jgi:thiol:disulfide interchange protein DsbD
MDLRVRVLAAAGLMLGFAPALSAGLLDRGTAPADVLPADQAFVVQPAIWDGNKLRLGIEIAPGCYLYRARLSVEAAEPEGYTLGAISLPPGTAHEDEHFGRVEIYRGSVQASFQPPAPRSAALRRLRVRLQGCAEDKVCYPMQTRLVDVIAP